MAAPQYRHVRCLIEADVLVLTLNGPQLHSDRMTRELRDEMLNAIALYQARKVIVDFIHVRVLSSTGLLSILQMRKHMQGISGRLILCGLSAAVEEVFLTTRLVGSSGSSPLLFDSAPTVAEALARMTDVVAKG